MASETCAFDLLGAEHVRELEPGRDGGRGRGRSALLQAVPAKPGRRRAFFEHVYFSRPDSTALRRVGAGRCASGWAEQLYREHPIEVDVVVPVPDSGLYAALGYARASGMPFEMGLVRNHYIGRTFIEPTQQIRNFGVRIKLNPVREILRGQADRAGRRFDRPRDDQPEDRAAVPGRRRAGDPRADLLPADDRSLLLRHRYAAARGADRRPTAPWRRSAITSASTASATSAWTGMLQAAGTAESAVCTACWTDEQPVALPAAEAEQLRLFEKA